MTDAGDSGDTWTLVRGEGPLMALAIHDGHELRPEVAERIALSGPERLREEDPHTGAWTTLAPTRMVALRSRFEVDLNRPPARAVYMRAGDAWGLDVWQQPPPPELVARSRAQHEAFYDALARVLDGLKQRHGRFVVFDLHTYNHRRGGPGSPFDPQSGNPDFNLGTESMDRRRWAPVVDRVVEALRGHDHLGRRPDVRENVRFKGAHLVRWIHRSYPDSGCCLSVEVKKFFMDEWSGALDVALHRGVGEALGTAARAALAGLERLE